MNNANVVVGIVQRFRELFHPIHQLIRFEYLLFSIRAQVGNCVSVHIFHRDATGVLVVHKIINAHDILVGKLETALGFALQIGQNGAIENDQFGKKF